MDYEQQRGAAFDAAVQQVIESEDAYNAANDALDAATLAYNAAARNQRIAHSALIAAYKALHRIRRECAPIYTDPKKPVKVI